MVRLGEIDEYNKVSHIWTSIIRILWYPNVLLSEYSFIQVEYLLAIFLVLKYFI